MPNQATVTAKIGPGLTSTAIVLHNVTEMDIKLGAQTVRFICDEGTPVYSLYEIATLTYTIASRIATIVMST